MNNVVFQGVCHLILADQSEGLLINDVAVAGCRNGQADMDIRAMAESVANALSFPLRRFYLPLPQLAQWEWADIPQALQQQVETVVVRSELTVLCSALDGGRALHFCGHPVLSGVNHDVWFPLAQDDDIFQVIERVMVMNHQAVNVTRVEPLTQSARCDDYRVTFNVRVTELKI